MSHCLILKLAIWTDMQRISAISNELTSDDLWWPPRPFEAKIRKLQIFVSWNSAQIQKFRFRHLLWRELSEHVGTRRRPRNELPQATYCESSIIISIKIVWKEIKSKSVLVNKLLCEWLICCCLKGKPIDIHSGSNFLYV